MPDGMPAIRDSVEADLNQAIVQSTVVWVFPRTMSQARLAWWRDGATRGFPMQIAKAAGCRARLRIPWRTPAMGGFGRTFRCGARLRDGVIGQVLLTVLTAHAERHGSTS
jgi:hypothetical protein